MWASRSSSGTRSPPAPTPRKRGASVGSSGIENASSSSSNPFSRFTRHAKDRLSATEAPVAALSSMAIAPAPASTGSLGSDRSAQRLSMERVEALRASRSSSDPLADEAYYAAQHKLGNFVKQGWLTKQGHMWKNWKTRYFVLYTDGTFAYYKSESRRKMLGCLTLQDGIVTVTHVDIRKIGKPYVLQIEKGFYKLLCYCCSQYEAELWVSVLQSVCQPMSPTSEREREVTTVGENTGVIAARAQMNKIFVTDSDIAQSVEDFKAAVGGQRIDDIQRFIADTVEVIIERYILVLLSDERIEMLPGNELKKLIQRFVEDRVFINLYTIAYESLETAQLRLARTRAQRNVKLLYAKTQSDFGIPDDLSAVSSWHAVVEIVNRLDCVSLPSQKIDVVNTAAKAILDTIAAVHGAVFDVSNDALSAVFRYVLVLSSIDDMCIQRALLSVFYKNHPACQNSAKRIDAFLDAIDWIEGFESSDSGPQSNSMSLAASRLTVSISTREIGIQFTTDGNGRGAIVHSIRKLSQAALSAAIVPGLSLIAINDEPVVLMPFREICQRLRTAALPKRLTFMTEFYYYQVLSLDSEMFPYLMCLAAARGDKDSAAWLYGSHVSMNELNAWDKARGKQVFGFKPPSGKSAPLFAAAVHGQGVMVKFLLGLGADPNLLNRKGKSPLHVVGQGADMAVIIEALVSAGAEIDAPDKSGQTPLMRMCAQGSIEGVATFLALGADIHRVAWSSGYTPLSFCVAARCLKLVDLCLSKGSDANVQTFDGDTSLHVAAANGDSDIILRLIEGGADPNIQNRYGQTPAAVVLATPSSHVPRDRVVLCLEILACAGGRLDKRDIFGRQVLHLASHLADERTARVVRKMSMLSFVASDDSDIDIYGCSAREYSECSRVDEDVLFLVALKPQDSWKVANGSDRALGARSYRLDDLVHSVVHDVRVDLADVVSFVLFLDTFSSLNEVVERLKAQTWSNERGRGLIRLFVLLLVFKERDVDEFEYVRERFYTLLQHFTGVAKETLAAKVLEYKELFREYLALQGSERCLELYTKVSLAMEDMYNPYIHGFDEPFPAKMHRHTEPSKWAEQCTLLTHALFASIPVEDFIKTSKQSHSIQFLCAKRWFQHLSAYVVNAVLLQESSRERAEVIAFFLSAADYCLALHNFDSLAAILYALQSTAVQRLRRTIDQVLERVLSAPSKKLLNDMQQLSDKGCREMNKIMRKATSPSMPYIGLYLQSFVGINELPAFEKPGLVNANRLRKMGELVVEILRRRSAPYALSFDDDIDKLLHVSLPFDSEESRYARSLALEPREAGAAPLSDRSSLVTADDLDIESEVRESIGSEGTFGIRQWLRKQKVVHRNRSRSSAQTAQHEWV